MMDRRILLPFVLGLATLVQGQTQVSSAPPSTPPQPPKEAAPVTFHSDLLDLSFTYPGSLIATKLPSLDEQHAETARNQPADEKPEYKKSDQCTDAALRAERKADPDQAVGTIAIYGNKRGTVIHLDPPITAKIVISRVGIECMPAKYKDHMEDVASVMASASIQEKGFKPIDQPIWYELGKTRIHFAAAQSDPEEKQSDAKSGGKPGRSWIASVAFISNGNIVSIYFESNDPPFLNEMLHGKLTLGKQMPSPLFPAEIGLGAPAKLLP